MGCHHARLALVLAALGPGSPAAAEEPIPVWRAAQLSGSERLELYTLGSMGAGPAVGQLFHMTGGTHRGPAPERLGSSMQVRPILRYVTNFNGGIPGERITLGGLDFIINDAMRAKGGIVLGASLRAGARYSYHHGSVMHLAADASAEVLTDEAMARQEAGLSLCVDHLLTGWLWMDGCASISRVWRNYDGDVTQASLSVGPTLVTTLAGIDQQISLRLTHSVQDGSGQTGLRGDWLGAVPGVGAVGLGLNWAEEVPGENAVLREVRASLVRPVAERDVTLTLHWSETGGAHLFGAERRDRTVRLGIDMPLTEGLDIAASAGRRQSTMDLYDETFGSLSLDLTRW